MNLKYFRKFLLPVFANEKTLTENAEIKGRASSTILLRGVEKTRYRIFSLDRNAENKTAE